MRILLWYLYTDDYGFAPDARLVMAAANEYGIDRLHTLAARMQLAAPFPSKRARTMHEGADCRERTGHIGSRRNAQLSDVSRHLYAFNAHQLEGIFAKSGT